MSQGVNTSEIAQMEAPAESVNPEHGLPESFGEGLTGRLLFWIAVSFSTFQIITSFGIPLDQPFIAGLSLTHLWGVAMVAWAAWLIGLAVRRRSIVDGAMAWLAVAGAFGLVLWFGGSMPSQVVRTIHVGFLCLVAGAMIANHRSGSSSLRAVGWIVGVASFLVGLYHWALYEELIVRAGELTTLDLIVGIAGIAILIYLIWRVMGPALPIVAGLFLSYCLFGHWLPAPLDHRGYSLEQVVEHMAFGTEGIYGTPTLVSSTYIFLFILFGAFMEKAGVIDFFNDISMAVFGDKQGGPGKVCVASSALMGTVSGSGVANVVASGQFTIPLMKRFGFTSAFAGGVEATSSMGGQIMPPVMGAVAFIMAETIDVPYSKIVEAAIIPAILYFAACYLAVHLEAGKRNLRGLPKSRTAERLDRAEDEMVPHRSARGARLSALYRLHAALRRRGGPVAHRGAHSWHRHRRRSRHTGSSHRILGRACPGRRLFARLDRDPRRSRRGGPVPVERLLRPGTHDASGLRRGHGGRCAPGLARRPRLRRGRHRDRHHDAHRARHHRRQPG